MHEQVTAFVSRRLRAVAVPGNVASMQAYLKTSMPFYGVANPARVPIFREMNHRFPPANRRQYEAAVRALWKLPHREEKYAAIEYAAGHEPFIAPASSALYEKLVREGAWWDIVDFLAANIISPLYLRHRTVLRPTINRWINDGHLWVRRAAILAHLRHKEQTDRRQLFAHCQRRPGEKEFFIRKAIGWALRQYSYANPQGVKQFLLDNREKLSGLSFREGAKVLVRNGQMNA